ncbi:PrsW family intramembrane metalloprotease [Protaetiibacter sp. SSC-01]|uniref:PrsW family intramembrane metalloprotease n=1 Tax=Protaetiibacter sp. SSC-01 TaxID=2759943 RepID=UPI001657172B|nr:PrsW family intramembrane metalloprotease [Protaetiibacter sp. SSC-01]QNO36638.1 PrsW family intramembrane metalloprotease [Protaetiibacter sp. SSC-01]
MSFEPTTNPSARQPEAAPAEVQAQAQTPPVPTFQQPAKPRHALFGWAIAGFIVVGVFGLALLAYLFLALGPVLLLLGGVLAIIPLVIVLLGVWWIDRWEPEPRGLLVFGFLWGAVMSVAIALIVDIGIQLTSYAAGIDADALDVLGTVVQAPVVEEAAKGFGVLLIFLIARKYFDGPVDGIVYAAVVAGGFAFTENILYFSQAMAYSGLLSVDTLLTFFVRGIMSPFAHAMFTAMTGLFIGLWGRKSIAGGIGGFFVGLLPAMGLHALWNGTSYLGLGGWFLLYLVLQVPLFAASIVLVVQLRKREAKLTQERLAEYANAGWLSHAEVGTLGTGAGRKQAMTWARAHGVAPLMKAYIRDSTTLAFTRQRIITGRDRIGAQRDEHELLMKLTSSRQALQAATPR